MKSLRGDGRQLHGARRRRTDRTGMLDTDREIPDSRARFRRSLACASVMLSAVLFATPAHAQLIPTTPMTATTPYPGPVDDHSCVTWGGYIYCVGGRVEHGSLFGIDLESTSSLWWDHTYFAPITASGIGAWQQTTSYGVTEPGGDGADIQAHQCVAANSYIYCIGGLTDSGTPPPTNATGAVWYAPLSPSGIGFWHQSHPYAVPAGAEWFDDLLLHLQDNLPDTIVNGGDSVVGQSCVASGGYIYCVGGEQPIQVTILSSAYISIPTNIVLSAPLGGSGGGLAGPWQYAGEYDGGGVAFHSCVTDNGFIYCVGGQINRNWWDYINPLTSYDASDEVWYAPLLPAGGVGAWQQTTSYGGGPVESLSCSVIEHNVVCAGGGNDEIWSAPLSSSGVGPWSAVATYEPQDPWYSALFGGSPVIRHWEGPSCVAANASLYCVGGHNADYDFSDVGLTNAAEFESYVDRLELTDGSSCSQLNGAWEASSSTCVARSTVTLDPSVTLRIDRG
jgi:hypothetical protein